MLTDDQRAHDIAVAALSIQYDKCKAEAAAEDSPVQFNIFQEYLKLYREALFVLKKTPPSN